MSANSEAVIKQITEKYGEEAADKLLSYLDMLLDRNQYINLTAVCDRDEAIIKHIADSLSVCDIEEYRRAERIIDVGTGGGFPGALLAIVSPEKQFTLLDSTLKRLKVIDEFADALGIVNIRTVHARAEEAFRKPEFGAQYDICVSRAVANLNTLSSWCLPFVRKGGCFISYKGENYKEELETASGTIGKLGGRLKSTAASGWDMPEISGHVLMVIEKVR